MQGEKSDVQVMLEGVGLFSKAGRVSGVKYPALKLRSQMLSGHVPSVKVGGDRLSGPKARSFLPKSVLDQLVEESKEEETEKAHQSVEINPASNRKSHKNRFKLPRANQTPPIGAYNCSFSLVERRIRTANFHLRPKTHRRSELPVRPDHFHSTFSPQAHVPSPVSFEKQVARPSILTQSTGVHEGRFIPFNDLSTVISKYHRVPSPHISHSKPQNPTRNSEFGPSFNTYQASYSLVQEDLGKGGALFDKQTSRPSNSLQIHDLEYKSSFRLVEKRGTAANFRTFQREKRVKSPLPAFMCEGVSRMSLDILMEKGLEMNSFSAEKSAESPQKSVRTATTQFSPSPRYFHRLRTN